MPKSQKKQSPAAAPAPEPYSFNADYETRLKWIDAALMRMPEVVERDRRAGRHYRLMMKRFQPLVEEVRKIVARQDAKFARQQRDKLKLIKKK